MVGPLWLFLTNANTFVLKLKTKTNKENVKTSISDASYY